MIVQERRFKVQVVLNFCTTCTFIDYKFSPLICILYTEFGPSYAADDQTFWAVTQWCCLSVKLTIQPLYGLGSIIVCVLRVVFVCFCRKCFQSEYHTMPICSHSSGKKYSFWLSFHTCPLHFPSVWGHTAEFQTVYCVSQNARKVTGDN
jgi:hypothetical protein